jgi:hypothetical protein
VLPFFKLLRKSVPFS